MMLYKQRVLQTLEEERQSMVDINRTEIAIGISKAMFIVRNMNAINLKEYGNCVLCGDETIKGAIYCTECVGKIGER